MNDSIYPSSIGRFIVPIFNFINDNQNFSKEIYDRADAMNYAVLYLVILDHESDYLEISREMTTLQAQTSANKLSVNVKIVYGENWFDFLEKSIKPNDIFICQEEYLVYDQYFKVIPLSSYLQDNYPNQVQIMRGYFEQRKSPLTTSLSEIAGLLGFLVIIGLFTWLQVSIESELSVFLSKIVISITFFFEIGAILIWHKIIFN